MTQLTFTRVVKLSLDPSDSIVSISSAWCRQRFMTLLDVYAAKNMNMRGRAGNYKSKP